MNMEIFKELLKDKFLHELYKDFKTPCLVLLVPNFLSEYLKVFLRIYETQQCMKMDIYNT